jgi:hypothetical protein
MIWERRDRECLNNWWNGDYTDLLNIETIDHLTLKKGRKDGSVDYTNYDQKVETIDLLTFKP